MDNVRIYIVTYNVATQSTSGNIKDLLGLTNAKTLPDFFVIGLQEVKSQPHNMVVDALFDDPWTNSFRNALAPHGFVKVKTVRLVGIVLSIFCLRRHIIHLRDMESIVTRTGLMGLWGNKGGVSLRLQIYGCSLCFVNCHFAPHDHLLKERIEEYNTLIQSQQFNCPETSSIFFHDYVFWFGDLNFRLGKAGALEASEIAARVSRGELEGLLTQDQLTGVMTAGDAFSELTESPVTFPPTYKYSMNSSSYDLKRRPAWTDRILYKVNQNVYENVTLEINSNSYKSHQHFSASDHKPVIGDFTIKVFSDFAERIVKFLPIQNWCVNEMNTAVCLIGNDVNPSPWDWVAVFEENFTSLDEYIGYIYVPLMVEEGEDALAADVKNAKQRKEEKLELRFHENFLRSAGRFQLVYFSKDSRSVLGVSNGFSATQQDCSDSPHVDW